ncbi:hypothetical protein FRC11_004720 [Ceratobasidium sp. 423]|nr:hypothetical protein FRC11_004720 [Ceratobasidium sp. 423]
MPSATRGGPVLSNQINDPAPEPEPHTTPTEGYNTRKKGYKYSHTKAPYVPPPPRPTKRRPPPVSLACKKQRLDVDSLNENGSTDPGANPNIHPEGCADGGVIEHSREGITANSNIDSLGGDDQQTNVTDTVFSPTSPHISNHLQNPVSPGPSNMDVGFPESQRCETTNPSEGFEKQPVISMTTKLQPSVAPSQVPQMSPNNQPGTWTSVRPGAVDLTGNFGTSTSASDFTTPRRPTRSLGLTTPTVVIIGTPPVWGRFNTEQDFPSFPPTIIQSFNQPSARIEDVDADPPLQQHLSGNPSNSLSSQIPHIHNFDPADSAEHASDALSETPTGCSRADSSSNLSNHQIAVSAGVSMGSTPQVESASLVVRSSTPNLLQMCNAIRRTLPPPPPLTSQSSTYQNSSTAMVRVSNPSMNHIGSISTPSTVSRSTSVSRFSGPHSRTASVTRTNSLALDDWNSREGPSTRGSPAPAANTLQISGPHAHTQPLRSLRQSNFHYDQVVFMNSMRRRWHWYLVADDLFPINTNAALELCAQYAEQHLGVSRTDCDITRTALDFVRRKDSGIRNLFQTGLLSIVEESYDVNTDATEKLDELISQSNYIYAEYNIETKKVSGRYRHPCLIRVLNAVLFTKYKRGRPIGISFMPEVIGGDHLTDATELPGGTGISVSMIALACTLVLYALQSIKAGDTSQRLGTRKGKPLHFTEKKYSGPYRNFVMKLQQYGRLEEVRKSYLEEVMKEYLRFHVDNNEASDVDIEVDDEMHSDGD